MKDWLSRENRGRIFLCFLILVLVIVNSQSLQLSYQTQNLLNESFHELVEARLETVAPRILPLLGGELDASAVNAISRELDHVSETLQIRSACLFDWTGLLLARSEACPIEEAPSIGQLERSEKQSLVENGWTVTGVVPRYNPQEAHVFGYRVLRAGTDSQETLLRLEIPASNLAASNRNLRSALIYQISAFAFVLLTLLFYLNRLLAPHRRLVAEARTVAGVLGPVETSTTEGEFLLSTFQGVVAQLKDKENELAGMHRREKARADETEALATDIIRSMTTALISLDEDEAVVLMNPAAEEIFRVEAVSAAGRPFSDVFPGSQELIDWVGSAVSRGESTPRAQAEYRLRDGKTIHLGVNVVPLEVPEGRARGALCLLADLTEIVGLRERVLLKDNLARLGEMTAGIAHEFRNGLSTILGNAKLLKKGKAAAEVSELIDALIDESHSLNHIVNEFLQFARPEALRITVFDLAEIVRDLVHDLEPRAREAGVDLSTNLRPCRLEADEVLLQKAITNLVLNAVEAAAETGAGAEVAVAVEADESGGLVFVRVVDNGPGIKEDNRSRIFTPFFTTKPDGTGLGLALVQKIALAHNGDVEIESKPGDRTVVTLKIPAKTESPMPYNEWM